MHRDVATTVVLFSQLLAIKHHLRQGDGENRECCREDVGRSPEVHHNMQKPMTPAWQNGWAATSATQVETVWPAAEMV